MLLRSPLIAKREGAMTGTTFLEEYMSWLASECLDVTLREPNPGVAAHEPGDQMQTEI